MTRCNNQTKCNVMNVVSNPALLDAKTIKYNRQIKCRNVE